MPLNVAERPIVVVLYGIGVLHRRADVAVLLGSCIANMPVLPCNWYTLPHRRARTACRCSFPARFLNGKRAIISAHYHIGVLHRRADIAVLLGFCTADLPVLPSNYYTLPDRRAHYHSLPLD